MLPSHRRPLCSKIGHQKPNIPDGPGNGGQVKDQLEALAPDIDVATIKLTRVDLDCLIGDLNHAIAKLGCDDEDVFDLSDRLEFILETGKGTLKAWY